MPAIPRLVVRAALAVSLGVAAMVTTSPSAAADVSPTYWRPYCDYGRACIYHTADQVWNLPNCGFNPVNDYYGWAKAHGNSFKVNYVNGGWDIVNAWSERTLNRGVLVTGVEVYC